jgi:hypothetical protein
VKELYIRLITIFIINEKHISVNNMYKKDNAKNWMKKGVKNRNTLYLLLNTYYFFITP